MEYFPHQQQQHTAQQVDDGSISGPATNINTISSNNNNINNVRSTNNTPPTSNTINSAATAATVDAATVAIAKDMLQLHHGSGSILTNNNNNNTSNTSNNSNNNTSSAALEAMNTSTSSNANTNSVVVAAGSGSSTSNSGVGNNVGSNLNTNHPPAHASTPVNSGGGTSNILTAPDNALGFLKYDQELLYITEPCTIIGRNSSTSHVHFHVAENNLVSRKHFQVHYDGDARDFFVQCLSKNGIFVDDFLQRRNADPLRLPNR